MSDHDEPVSASSRSIARTLADRVRAADDRVSYVERAFLAQRLGLAGDDLELLVDGTVADLLALPSSVVLPLAARRLLDQLDAHRARAHPVDLDYLPRGVTVARVLTDEEETLTVALDHDYHPGAPGDGPAPPVATLELERDDEHVATLTVDDAEALAYALLRLVQLARSEPLLPIPPVTPIPEESP